jgi:hypothetical protein
MRVFQLVHPELSSEFSLLRTVDTVGGNLPVELTTFIGRERELSGLSAAIKESRVVTVVGVGGVGKTRLAIHAAAELAPGYADRVWLCELAGADDAESMHQLVASTVGVASRAGLDLRDSVVEYVVTKAVLLVQVKQARSGASAEEARFRGVSLLEVEHWSDACPLWDGDVPVYRH